MDDADSTDSDYVLLKRTKRHDYFTSCLPNPQKGTAVDLPLSGNAPVVGIGKGNQVYTDTVKAVYETGGTGTVNYQPRTWIGESHANYEYFVKEDPENPGYPAIFADLGAVGAASINTLRMAFQIQRLLERDQRSGTRYIESVKAHFGVTSPDLRAIRPVFLGGNSTMFMVTPVPQTSAKSATGTTTPQGNLAAFATCISKGEGFSQSFTEHGVILGLCCIRGDVTYQQGIPRMFSRSTRYDFYLPVLSHLGEQAVLNKEIYAQDPATKDIDGVTADNELVFGYQERWSEYKYKPSEICGELRSTYSTPLDSWHLAEEFTDLPVLGPDFIVQNTPQSRVLAVTDKDGFFFDSEQTCVTVRPMPMNSTPGLIDHF